MTTYENTHSWFALQVRTRWEASTAHLLGGKGYETLLPTYQTKKRWSGRIKEVTAPLFPGYVFCRFDVHNRLPVLVTPGVTTIVSRGKSPVPVSESEISAIQAVVASGLRSEPWPFLEVGQQVRIETEPLRGLEGILLSVKGSNRIVISVSLLRRSVALEIDKSSVTPIGSARLSPGCVASHPLLQGGIA